MARNASSPYGMSSSPNYDICDPRDLQFTEDSIKDSFSKSHTGVKVEETALKSED